jgi:hypothetical protein
MKDGKKKNNKQKAFDSFVSIDRDPPILCHEFESSHPRHIMELLSRHLTATYT